MDDDIRRLVNTPLYRKAEQLIAEQIASGEIRPGERLPNEFELAAKFGISQGTIRKALQALESRGLITRSPRRGTIVAISTPEDTLYSFFRMRDEDNRLASPEPNFEEIIRRKTNSEDELYLGSESEEVYELRRIRNWKGRPLVQEKIVLRCDIFEGIENHGVLPISLYPFLQQTFCITIVRTEERLKAVSADAETAKALGVKKNAPVLSSVRLAYDLNDRVVEYRVSSYCTDEAAFTVVLQRESRGIDPS